MKTPSEHELVVWRERVANVVEVLPNTVVIRFPESDSLSEVPRSEIRFLPTVSEPATQTGISTIDPDTWNQAAKLAATFRALLKCGKPRSIEIESIAVQHHMSARTVWRRLERYLEESTTGSLLPRQPGRKKGARVLDEKVEAVIQHAIDEQYLVPERPTITQVLESIVAECLLQDLPLPCRETVASRIADRCPRSVVEHRDGRKSAEQQFDPVPGHVEANEVLERVEIDHTRADTILVASTPKREVLGRPWVTLAIDCRSRMILGFYISFDAPSSASVALCLATAAMPKLDYLQQHGVAGEWPAQGIPADIWVDNAPEFRAEALIRGCQQAQIGLNYRPVGESRMGGTIERMVGTMMGACHLLPGTTKSNVNDRADYDSEARAVMTLEEFESWFAEQVVTQYHLKIHRSLDTSPLLAWKMATASCPPPPPKNELDYYATFLPGGERRLTRTGVQLNSLTYWHASFSAWVGRGLRVLVTHHPNDVRHVYVRLPGNRVVEATVTRQDVPEIGVKSWNLWRLQLRMQASAPQYLIEKAKGLKRNQQRVKESAEACARARRSRGGVASESRKDFKLASASLEFDIIVMPEVLNVSH